MSREQLRQRLVPCSGQDSYLKPPENWWVVMREATRIERLVSAGYYTPQLKSEVSFRLISESKDWPPYYRSRLFVALGLHPIALPKTLRASTFRPKSGLGNTFSNNLASLI